MKTLLRFLLPLCLAGGAFAQWDLTNVGTYNPLYSIVFTDSLTGYTAGSGGVLFKTADGGVSWNPESSGVDLYDLHGLAFRGDTGVVVGDNATVLRTTNGGTLWSAATVSVPPGLFPSFKAVTLGNTTGWAVGTSGNLYRTTNGGANWTKRSSGVTTDLNGLFFQDSLGWVAGAHGKLLTTTDGGGTWSNQTLDTAQTLNSIYFVTVSLGYVAGDDGSGGSALWKTTDKGVTWNPAAVSGLPLFSVRFTDAVHGYAAGGTGTLFTTVNAGGNWTRQDDSLFGYTPYDFTSVYFLNSQLGFIADSWGDVYKTTTAGVTTTAVRVGAFPAAAAPSLRNGRLTYSLPRAANVSIALYGAGGARVRALFQGSQAAGSHALDLSALKIAAGSYLVKIDADGLHRSVPWVAQGR